MRAVENVELEGANSEILNQRFAAALRGDYKAKWDEWNQEERTEFLLRFRSDVEDHARAAFSIGVQYGLNKSQS